MFIYVYTCMYNVCIYIYIFMCVCMYIHAVLEWLLGVLP